jgi:hypothetical protein
MKALPMRFLLAFVPILICLALMAGPRPASAQTFPTVTVNPTGTVSSDGFRVGLSGTLRCRAGSNAFLSVSAFQFVRGQVLLNASGSAQFVCNGIDQNWAITAESQAGFFKSGRANVRATLFTGFPGPFEQTEFATEVRLRKGEPPPESPPQSPPFLGAVNSTAGAVGGATALAIVAAGMTFGFVRVVRRSERRDRHI